MESLYATGSTTMWLPWPTTGPGPRARAPIRPGGALRHRAGDRALAQLAHDEAVTHYSQALDLLDVAGTEADDERRVELLISLGEAQRRAGRPVYRETLLEAAHQAGRRRDADALARAALANNRDAFFSSMGTVDEERVAVIEAALDAVGAGDSSTRARLLALLSSELFFAGDLERRVRLSDEALAVARRLDDPSTLAWVCTARSVALLAPRTIRERLATTDELLAVTERLHDPGAACTASAMRARTLMDIGDLTQAERAVTASLRLGRRGRAAGAPLLADLDRFRHHAGSGAPGGGRGQDGGHPRSRPVGRPSRHPVLPLPARIRTPLGTRAPGRNRTGTSGRGRRHPRPDDVPLAAGPPLLRTGPARGRPGRPRRGLAGRPGRRRQRLDEAGLGLCSHRRRLPSRRCSERRPVCRRPR